MSELRRLLQNLPQADADSAAAVAERAAQVLRPAGALARLDAVAAWLAGWQRTTRPAVTRPHAIVFAADHGVASDGVSAYPQEVTGAMLDALSKDAATATALAHTQGAELSVVDVGVGQPTANIRVADAMDVERFDAAVQAGVNAVAAVDADVLVFGEMGIGNTTAASAVTASLLGVDARDVTGPGTGVQGEALEHKIYVVEETVRRVEGETDPLELLRRVGGLELAAIAGATMAARHRSIPVVTDGFIATAAIAPLAIAVPGALDHCWAGHRSPELGHSRLLDRLDMEPLLELDLRLGEGSGALLALPLLKLAAAAVTDVATFAEWGLA